MHSHNTYDTAQGLREDDSLRPNEVIKGFTQRHDGRRGLKRQTVSWQIKLLLICSIILALWDISGIFSNIGGIGGIQSGHGIGIGLLVFALLALFISYFQKHP